MIMKLIEKAQTLFAARKYHCRAKSETNVEIIKQYFLAVDTQGAVKLCQQLGLTAFGTRTNLKMMMAKIEGSNK